MSKTTQAMKSHKNEARSNRWKWMAGATAATAGITASQAYGVTINLLNNYISAGGNHLNADLTGDRHPDVAITGAYYSFRCSAGCSGGAPDYVYRAGVNLNGVHAFGIHRPGYAYVVAGVGSHAIFNTPGNNGPTTVTGSIPVFFKDLHINGGAPTKGSLEVTAGAGYVQLDSLTYNTPTPAPASRLTVPDQGSSLALLAMGAGGVLALRRWRTAQGCS